MIAAKTIDAHVGGAPLRLLVDGVPPLRGTTMAEKEKSMVRQADRLRRAILLEPRGHAGMWGAVLTEPASPGSHAGVLFMHAAGFSPIAAHGVIAAATIALEHKLIMPGGNGDALIFDTCAGTVRAAISWRADRGDEPRVQRVTFVNVPSFVVQGGVEIAFGPRRVRADVAFGGGFYAIVDAESVGVPLDRSRVPELSRAGVAIAAEVDAAIHPVHPLASRVSGIEGVVFTGPSHSGVADLRIVAVTADGTVDRSASGTATAAAMAVLDVMGLLDDTRVFVTEGLVDTSLQFRVAHRTLVGDAPAIAVEIEGRAWTTGMHTFVLDEDDPLRDGVSV